MLLPKRILIVDDHAIVRSALAVFLETHEDFILVGEATSGEEAIRLCAELAPDVVLMDRLMPEMDGVTATRIIRDRFPSTQVVILTHYMSDDLAPAARRAGASGYLSKESSSDEIAQSIRDAAKVSPPSENAPHKPTRGRKAPAG
jgi:two-component system, NarL family, response regulator LiaR